MFNRRVGRKPLLRLGLRRSADAWTDCGFLRHAVFGSHTPRTGSRDRRLVERRVEPRRPAVVRFDAAKGVIGVPPRRAAHRREPANAARVDQ